MVVIAEQTRSPGNSSEPLAAAVPPATMVGSVDITAPAGPAASAAPVVTGAPGETAAPRTRADDLQAKQDALKAAQDQLAALGKAAAALQADVTLMQANAKEIADTAAGYDAALPPLSKRLDALNTGLAQKLTVALAVITDDRARIDGIVTDFDKGLNSKIKDAADAAAASVKAVTEAGAAQAGLQAAQAAFTEVKSWANQLTAKVAAAESLLSKASTAESQGDYVALYLMVNEAQALLPKNPTATTAEFINAVQAAQDAVVAAQHASDNAKADVALAGAKADTTQKAADTAKASRTADLLAAVMKAPAAQR